MRKRRDVTFYRLHFTPKAAVAEAEAGVESREWRGGNRELCVGGRAGARVSAVCWGDTAASVVDSGDLLLHATDVAAVPHSVGLLPYTVAYKSTRI